LEALTKHLVAANPRRILWGSDWPHAQRWEDQVGIGIDTIQPYLQVDNLVWLSTLKGWLSEEEFHLMMVTNPKELFD
jgi:predicted TIM-barrel fold metal-dependent hydrolase